MYRLTQKNNEEIKEISELEGKLQDLKDGNEAIMTEILGMKKSIQDFVKIIEGINKDIKKCERDIQLEK